MAVYLQKKGTTSGILLSRHVLQKVGGGGAEPIVINIEMDATSVSETYRITWNPIDITEYEILGDCDLKYKISVNDVVVAETNKTYHQLVFTEEGEQTVKVWAELELKVTVINEYNGQSAKNVFVIDVELQSVVFAGNTKLSAARDNIAASNTTDYAIFYRGRAALEITADVDNAVEAFDATLTLTKISTSIINYYRVCGFSFSTRAIFAGGYGHSTPNTRAVISFDNTLTANNAIPGLSVGVFNVAGESAGGYAFIGGGDDTGGGKDNMNAYDEVFTKYTPAPLSYGGGYTRAASVQNFVLFTSGNKVDSYDDVLTKTELSSLPDSPYGAAVSSDTHAIFCGQAPMFSFAYDETLTRLSMPALSNPRSNLALCKLGAYILAGGGRRNTGVGVIYADVEMYDAAFVKTQLTGFDIPAENVSASAIGDFALFAGGRSDTGAFLDTVRIYQLV